MRIDSLHLQDFRNYQDARWDFEADKVVFYGSNGQGKTNILEAIGIMSVTKSWRDNTPRSLIKNEAENGKITLKQGYDVFEGLIQLKSRSFSKNSKSLTQKALIGQIPTLLFCPEMIHLFSGVKKQRILFFDRFLAQMSETYKDMLLKSDKAHRNKTALLKQSEIYSSSLIDQLQPWNEVLVETVPEIYRLRMEFLNLLNPILEMKYQKISGTQEPVEIQLVLSEDYEPTEAGCRSFLEKYQRREIAAMKNFLSPGRDDFIFELREKPLIQSASRGESRSMLLALIAAQKEYLIEQKSVSPILLLDDVFSELDTQRQSYLERLCEGVQTFFSTTHDTHFEGFETAIQKIKVTKT